ncbi:MAG TPA: hypothetical protein PLA88_09255 [Bacteroidales bacterium]|jgi:hypothetical protein|nr:hypothetical protein [Bacteroidales bacterium]
MKTNNAEKLELLEKAWSARQISETDYLMWKKVYMENADAKSVGQKRKKAGKK